MGRCSDLKGSAVKSVVLGIRLANAAYRNHESIAREVLESPKVREAIHEAFREQAGSLIEASLAGEALSGAAAQAFIAPIAESAHPKAVQQVKNLKEYKEAKAGLKRLKCSYDAAPIGVFVDNNKTWLIIAGALVGVGSVAAMYKTRAGDVPAKAMAMIAGVAASDIEVGNVTFDVTGVNFKPSTREAGGSLGVTMGPVKAIHSKFEMSAGFKGKKLQEFKLSDSLVMPLGDHTTLTGKASAGLKDDTPAFDMALVAKYKRDRFTLEVTAYGSLEGSKQTGGLKATAAYKVKSAERILGPRSQATLGATGKIEAMRENGRKPFGAAATLNVGLTATF